MQTRETCQTGSPSVFILKTECVYRPTTLELFPHVAQIPMFLSPQNPTTKATHSNDSTHDSP